MQRGGILTWDMWSKNLQGTHKWGPSSLYMHLPITHYPLHCSHARHMVTLSSFCVECPHLQCHSCKYLNQDHKTWKKASYLLLQLPGSSSYNQTSKTFRKKKKSLLWNTGQFWVRRLSIPVRLCPGLAVWILKKANVFLCHNSVGHIPTAKFQSFSLSFFAKNLRYWIQGLRNRKGPSQSTRTDFLFFQFPKCYISETYLFLPKRTSTTAISWAGGTGRL